MIARVCKIQFKNFSHTNYINFSDIFSLLLFVFHFLPHLPCASYSPKWRAMMIKKSVLIMCKQVSVHKSKLNKNFSSWTFNITTPKITQLVKHLLVFFFLLRILALIVNCLSNGEELTIIVIIWTTNDDDYEVKWPNFPSCWGNDDRWCRFKRELMTIRQEFYRENIYWIFPIKRDDYVTFDFEHNSKAFHRYH